MTPLDIERYASHRVNTDNPIQPNGQKSKIKATTVNKEVSAVRMMLDKSVDWKYISVNPARAVRQLKDDGTLRLRYLRSHGIRHFMEVAQARSNLPDGFPHTASYHFSDMPEFIAVGCNSGLRLSELLYLEFADVDFEQDVLTVRNKPHLDPPFNVKNHQLRHVRMNTTLKAVLEGMLAKKHPHSDFVFHRPDGNKRSNIRSAFNKVVEDAGLNNMDPAQNVTANTMRHTFGSQLAIQGVSLRKIQKMMEHKSITTTEAVYSSGPGGDARRYPGAGVGFSGLFTTFFTKLERAGRGKCNAERGIRTPTS